MDFGERSGPSPVSFQIAPLMDIVFLLLIWLIVSYAVAQEERNLNIRLPHARSAAETVRTLEDVVVDVAADGALTHQRLPLSPAGFERLLTRLRESTEGQGPDKEPGVILRVDENTPHRYVVAVLDACGRARVRRVFFATGAEEPKEPVER